MAQSTINLPVKILYDARDSNWMLYLSLFVKLKSYYSNSVFYNCTLQKLSQLTGVPRATLSRQINFLKSKGLLHKHHGNLCCLGNDKIKSLYEKGSYSIDIEIDNENQLARLQAAIIGLNLKDQQYHIDKSGLGKNCKTNKVYKTFKKRFDDTRGYTGISVAGIGRLLNVSRTTAQTVKNRCKQLGFLKAKTRRKVLFSGIDYQGFLAFKNFTFSFSSSVYYDKMSKSIIQRLMDELTYVNPSPITPLQ